MAEDPRREAQARADQIRAFRRELQALEREGVFDLPVTERTALNTYHDQVLERLARDFDVDRSERAGQLSRGLRLASLFGAAALVAAITALVQRFWSGFSLPVQVTLLTAFPLAALAGVHLAAERERTRYVAGLFALVACGTAWFAIGMIARLLDLPMSELLLWPAGAFALAVALSYGFRLVFAIALAMFVVAAASVFFAAGGVPWPTLFERLEPLAATAFVLAGVARSVAAVGPGFADATRHTGVFLGLGALLLLSNLRGSSLLSFTPDVAMALYQVLFPIVAVAVLWRALGNSDGIGVAIATGLLALFLVVRYVDWFWDWLPAWAFFLILAAAAFAAIALLQTLRRRSAA
jgi:hypothetical protein